MRERTVRWIAIILLVAIIFEGATSTRPKKAKSSKNNGSKEKISDLEGSETSYNLPYMTDYGNSFQSFGYTQQPSNSFSRRAPSNGYNSNFLLGFGQNQMNDIHQEIKCGDTFPRRCEKSRYRTYDGSCNNLRYPTWGMANTRYARLLPANYADGIRAPTTSVTGSDLPLSRMVSYTLFPHVDIDDPIWTLVAMQWGQVITHDMGLIDGTTQSKPHATKCCTDDGQLVESSQYNSQCFPILIPYNDPVYSRSNTRCFNFVRSTTDLDRGCSSQYKPAEQLNTVTHLLDLSLVYGSGDQVAALLRAGSGGRLNVDVRNNREWPPAVPNKTDVCDTLNPNDICYQTGDSRGNQNTQLTVLQIILLREHNRVADTLAHLNPHWTDETIYQETRRIVIAEHQQISYYEWLPIFLGVQGTYGNKILYETKDYVDDYDPNEDPSVINEHSNAAFRYFHSLIAGRLNLVSENRYTNGALRLSNHFNRPAVIEDRNNMDDLTRGMAYQPQKASDQYFDEEITQYLFRMDRPLGTDLRAIDIQRNRDHGLASYNSFREYCGLPRAKFFTDFADYISLANIQKLSNMYASPEDVELTVGGSLEQHVPGTLSGPTFLCILTRQFYRTRVADRYWFERSDHDIAFTIEQLNEIRKSSISRLFCDNGDHITHMQPRGFQQVSGANPVVSCDTIPAMDLSLWKDYAPHIETRRNLGYPYYKKK